MPVITPGSTIVGAVQLSGLAPNATPIESWLNGLLNGRAYGTSGAPAPVAAEHTIIELRNPAASGHNLWVYLLSLSTQAADSVFIGQSTTPFLTGGLHGVNLLTGAQGSVGMVASGANAALQGGFFLTLQTPALQTVSVGQPWVIVLAQGCSLTVQTLALNNALVANFTWMEV